MDGVCDPKCYNEECHWDGDGAQCAEQCKTDTVNFPDGCIHPVCHNAGDEDSVAWCFQNPDYWHSETFEGAFFYDVPVTHAQFGGGYCAADGDIGCSCQPDWGGGDCGQWHGEPGPGIASAYFQYELGDTCVWGAPFGNYDFNFCAHAHPITTCGSVGRLAGCVEESCGVDFAETMFATTKFKQAENCACDGLCDYKDEEKEEDDDVEEEYVEEHDFDCLAACFTEHPVGDISDCDGVKALGACAEACGGATHTFLTTGEDFQELDHFCQEGDDEEEEGEGGAVDDECADKCMEVNPFTDCASIGSIWDCLEGCGNKAIIEAVTESEEFKKQDKCLCDSICGEDDAEEEEQDGGGQTGGGDDDAEEEEEEEEPMMVSFEASLTVDGIEVPEEGSEAMAVLAKTFEAAIEKTVGSDFRVNVISFGGVPAPGAGADEEDEAEPEKDDHEEEEDDHEEEEHEDDVTESECTSDDDAKELCGKWGDVCINNFCEWSSDEAQKNCQDRGVGCSGEGGQGDTDTGDAGDHDYDDNDEDDHEEDDEDTNEEEDHEEEDHEEEDHEEDDHEEDGQDVAESECTNDDDAKELCGKWGDVCINNYCEWSSDEAQNNCQNEGVGCSGGDMGRRRTEAGKEVVFKVVAQVAAGVEIADMVSGVLTLIETKTGEDGDFADVMAETMAEVIEEYFPDAEVEIDLSAMVVSAVAVDSESVSVVEADTGFQLTDDDDDTFTTGGGGAVAGVGKVAVGLVAVLFAAMI